MNQIPRTISEKVLTIGPDHHNHRGGVGAVIEIYSKYYECFPFIPTYKSGSLLYRIFVFIGSIFKLNILLLFNRKIKVIHIHGASNGSFFRKFICFTIAKYIFRKKVIYHIHGGGFNKFYANQNKLSRFSIKLFIENSDIVITLSDSWRRYYINNFKTRRILIIPNIIDYPYASDFKQEDNLLSLLFLGLICDAKGIFDLIQVIAANKEKYQGKIHLIIGGNGEVKRLKNIINEQNLEGLIEFVGWIAKEEKTAILQNSDIYILPSYNEGLPISILEAMSYGQAIISTRVGGIPEIVIPEKNGILISPGNLKEIESAIDFFIDHPGKIEDYGRASKQIVKKHLPDSVLNELSIIYNSLLK